MITESEDDGLLDRYLGGEQVGFETIVDDLETAVARGAFHPVLPSSPSPDWAFRNCWKGSAAASRRRWNMCCLPVYTPAGREPGTVDRSANGPLVAEVVKTTTDPYVGRVSLVRLFSGTLLPDVPVHVSGHFARFSGHPDRRDLACGARSRRAGRRHLASTRCNAQPDRPGGGRGASWPSRGWPMRRPATPSPTRPTRPCSLPGRCPNRCYRWPSRPARPVRRTSWCRVWPGCRPRIRPSGCKVNPSTEQLVMWTMGEQQLEVLLDRLRSRAGIEVVVVAGEGRRPGNRESRAPRAGTARQTIRWARTVRGRPDRGRAAARRAAGSSSSTGWSAARSPGSSSPVSRRVIRATARGTASTGIRWSTCGSRWWAARHTASTRRMRPSRWPGHSRSGRPRMRRASSCWSRWTAVTIIVDDEFVGAVLADLASRRGEGARHRSSRYRPDVRTGRGPGGGVRPVRRRPPLPCTRHRNLQSAVSAALPRAGTRVEPARCQSLLPDNSGVVLVTRTAQTRTGAPVDLTKV